VRDIGDTTTDARAQPRVSRHGSVQVLLVRRSATLQDATLRRIVLPGLAFRVVSAEVGARIDVLDALVIVPVDLGTGKSEAGPEARGRVGGASAFALLLSRYKEMLVPHSAAHLEMGSFDLEHLRGIERSRGHDLAMELRLDVHVTLVVHDGDSTGDVLHVALVGGVTVVALVPLGLRHAAGVGLVGSVVAVGGGAIVANGA